MKFMLLCYHEEQALERLGEAALEEKRREAVRRVHELDAKGQYILASPLEAVATATSVKVRDGKRLVTDGPFAETREVLGGFYLVDVKDMDEAIEVAARQPGATLGTVEVRPVMELTGLPGAR